MTSSSRPAICHRQAHAQHVAAFPDSGVGQQFVDALVEFPNEKFRIQSVRSVGNFANRPSVEVENPQGHGIRISRTPMTYSFS